MPKALLNIPAAIPGQALHLGQLYGASRSLMLAEQIASHEGLSAIVCSDMADADQIEQEVLFFCQHSLKIFRFPDLETLPYDQFSPHQDIISERIKCLANIQSATHGVLILPISTLIQKVTPPESMFFIDNYQPQVIILYRFR